MSKLQAQHRSFVAERPTGADEDVHMLASIVDAAIERYSEVGDLVIDPFAGFGTTLERATALGRSALGIELLPERVEHARTQTPDALVIEGDARELVRLLQHHTKDAAQSMRVPHAQLVLSSPPYMTRNAHPANPLTAYVEDTGDYERYLAELSWVAAQCAHVLRDEGYLVWNVANIQFEGEVTNLIADCRRVCERHLSYVNMIEIEWDHYPHDLVADALLVFQRTGHRARRPDSHSAEGGT